MTALQNPVEELSQSECWDLLRREVVGRLAVAVANIPDIFPINYIVDHGSIVFRSAPGTKLAAAVLGRGVALEIDGYDTIDTTAWSVVVKGARPTHRKRDGLHRGRRPSPLPVAHGAQTRHRSYRTGDRYRPTIPRRHPPLLALKRWPPVL